MSRGTHSWTRCWNSRRATLLVAAQRCTLAALAIGPSGLWGMKSM
jgi:hypothetical protein